MILKVIVLGDSGVGKTSLMERFVNKCFVESYKATIGANFLSTTVEVEGTGDSGGGGDDGGSGPESVGLQIWDTAGQERFQSLGNSFYRGSDACVLVFDMTIEQTFHSLDRWRTEFLTHSGVDPAAEFPFLVVANKADLEEDRTVGRETAQAWAADHGALYYECSAKGGNNVDAAFQQLAQVLHRRLPTIMESQRFLSNTVGSGGIDLSKSNRGNTESSCNC